MSAITYHQQGISVLVSQTYYYLRRNQSISQSINQSIPLFKCQTNIAVEEPLDGDTMN